MTGETLCTLICRADFAIIDRRAEGVVQQSKILSEGQRAYEAKRAAKAGMSLDKWLASKQRQQEVDAKARQKTVAPSKPAKPPGFFSRLLERANRPLGS
jgi:hypothetical protein